MILKHKKAILSTLAGLVIALEKSQDRARIYQNTAFLLVHLRDILSGMTRYRTIDGDFNL